MVRNAFLLLAASLLLLAGACTDDPVTSMGAEPVSLKTSGTTVKADPVWTATGAASVKGKSYNTINVMNYDGSAAATIVQEPSGTGVYRPRWSPDGKHVVYQRSRVINCVSHQEVWRVDVAVTTSNTVVASNAKALTDATADGMSFNAAVWSPSSTRTEIAVGATDKSTGVSTIYALPSAGGTRQSLVAASSTQGALYPHDWNVNGDSLVYTETSAPDVNGARTNSIRILYRPTSTVARTVYSTSAYRIGNVRWTHSSSSTVNMLVFERIETVNGSDVKSLYLLDLRAQLNDDPDAGALNPRQIATTTQNYGWPLWTPTHAVHARTSSSRYLYSLSSNSWSTTTSAAGYDLRRF